MGLLLAMLLAVYAAKTYAEPPMIAIMMDDIGYRATGAKRVLALPSEVAISVLPHSPFGAKFAARARAQSREVRTV